MEETIKAPNPFDLTGKSAIVTGAASGIGRAVALELAKFGAKVVLADIAISDAEEVATEIRGMKGQALLIKVDVTNRDEVKQMVQSTLERFGKIDILVNCAGILSQTPTARLTEDDLEKTLDVNLKGTILCCQAVMEHMIDQQSGKIVNIGSSISSKGSICNLTGGGVDYCLSKAAVQCFTRTLAWELASEGINVNAVAPGTTHTPMHKNYWKAAVDYYVKSVPIGRLAEPEDIAPVVLFLVTDAARYIVGQTIHVNGGQIMEG